MTRSVLTFALFASAAFGQYKMEPAGAPPSELAPEVLAVLEKQGTKILTGDGKVWCEVWFRAAAPPAGKITEENVTLTNIAYGALLGAIRFPGTGSDRRGQNIKPGVYTLRFGLFPVNGDHQGVAPQRDFLVFSLAAEDKDPNTTPAFDPLVAASRKVSGTQHPAVLSMWKVDSDFKPGFAKMGDNDWVLQTKIAGTQVAVILVGKVEA
jgi:hypothetical protein